MMSQNNVILQIYRMLLVNAVQVQVVKFVLIHQSCRLMIKPFVNQLELRALARNHVIRQVKNRTACVCSRTKENNKRES